MIKFNTLANGIRVTSDSFEHVQTVALGVWLNIGSRNEIKQENGIAHVLEHMAFKGTNSRSSLEIANLIENVGGYMNAYTSKEYTAYYIRVLKKDVELAIDILADILQNSIFDQEEFQKEQGVIIQEIGRSNDTPDDVVFDHFQSTCFGDNSMGWSILGSVENIKNLTPTQVKNYMHKNYGANNMVFSAAGNIEHENLCNLVDKYFNKVVIKANKQHEKISYKGGDHREHKKLEQVHMVLGFDSVSILDENYYTYLLLSSVLGGGMSSRLFYEIREKRGLVYTISADQHSYTDCGIFSIYAGTGAKEIEELVPIVCSELKKATNDINEIELNRVKNQLQAGILMGLESTSNRCERLARQIHLYNKPIEIDQIIKKINKVSVNDLKNACVNLLKTKPTFTTLGIIDKVASYDKLEEMLKV